MDALRGAYLTVELGPGASAREVRQQFKRLARRWHPDRFARDPQGQAEAAARMRRINAAYELIQSVDPPADSPAAEPRGMSNSPNELREPVTKPLSRDEIDGIVKSIGTESAFEVLAGFLFWSWPVFLALFISPPGYQWLEDEIAGRPHSLVRLWQALLVGLAVILRLWQRRTRR
jgi:hypothetical protein